MLLTPELVLSRKDWNKMGSFTHIQAWDAVGKQKALPNPFFILNFLFILYLWVFYSQVSLYYLHVWCLWRPEERIRYPRTSITDGHGLTHR